MTAEIGILNRHAVALAADSAVTIGTGNKIYHSANKLFALSKFNPVGIMIYGNAELMGIPWETIIKEFRKKLGSNVHPHLEDYANEFIDYLVTPTWLKFNNLQDEYVEMIIDSYYIRIRDEIKKNISKKLRDGIKVTESITKDEINNVVNKRIVEISSASYLPLYDKAFEKEVKSRYTEIIKTQTEKVFDKLPISKAVINKIKEIGINLLLKDYFGNNYSGIVIAGYGSDEVYPSIVNYKIGGIVNNRLKYKKVEEKSNSISAKNPSVINAFAQYDMITNFIEGMHPELGRFNNSFIKDYLNLYPSLVIEEISKELSLTEDIKKNVIEKIKEQNISFYKNYLDSLKNTKKKFFITPLLNIVSVLPKDELASMAEAFVSITSINRHFTDQKETVGGPIDVAVISKGDGFIWIKRKHYFNADMNKMFIDNYFR